MKKLLFTCLLFCWHFAKAQNAASVTTDLSLLRSLSEGQQFTAIGQTVQFQYHFSPKESGYTWISYYSPGQYKNVLTATAKDPLTTPASINYTVNSEMRFRQLSLGWKHYFKGAHNSEDPFLIYGAGGFGILFAQVENNYDKSIDTVLYQMPGKAVAGSKEVRRLTFDLALGSEFKIAGSFYLYAEVRSWLKASSNPSPYLYNEKMPQVLMLNGGIRVLFDSGY